MSAEIDPSSKDESSQVRSQPNRGQSLAMGSSHPLVTSAGLLQHSKSVHVASCWPSGTGLTSGGPLNHHQDLDSHFEFFLVAHEHRATGDDAATFSERDSKAVRYRHPQGFTR